MILRYPDNWPPRKTIPQSGLGFGSRLGLVLGLGATVQMPPSKIDPWLGLGVRLGSVLALGAIFLGGNCPRTDIKSHPLTIDINLFKQININQMFDKIQIILMMKTSILNNRISRFNNKEKVSYLIYGSTSNPNNLNQILMPISF